MTKPRPIDLSPSDRDELILTLLHWMKTTGNKLIADAVEDAVTGWFNDHRRDVTFALTQGVQYSDLEVACPTCGSPISAEPEQTPDR